MVLAANIRWLCKGELLTGACIAALLCVIPGSADAKQASYRCEKGVTFEVDFAANGKTALLFLGGGLEVQVARAKAPSGFRFSGGGYDLHGKDPSALLTRPEGDTLTCRLLPKARPVTAKQAPAPEPEPTGPSFDCDGTLSPTQQRICNNSLLSELDGRMASIYAGLRKKLKGKARKQLQAEQKAWIAERDKCGTDASCIEDHYYGRNAYLEEYEIPGASPPPPPVVVAPSAAPPPERVSAPSQPVAPAPGAAPAEPLASPPPAVPAQTPVAALPPSLPQPGQSTGGLVRSGPGTKFRKLDTLRKGDRLVILEDTGVKLGKYNWFKIRYGSQIGYQWGGLICGKDHAVTGALKVCN